MVAVCWACLGMMAQEVEYDVAGEVLNGTNTVYLYKARFSGTEVLDSMVVTDGRFAFHGSAPKDELLGVGGDEDFLVFVNDGTPIRMKVYGSVYEGQKIAAPYQLVEASGQNMQLGRIDTQINNILMSLEGVDEADEDAYGRARASAINTEYNILLENRNTFAPLVFLTDVIDEVDYEDLAPFMDSTSVYYHHPAMAEILEYYQAMGKKRLGITFHDAQLQDTYGRNHLLSEYCGKGNYVLIDFWASWCTPCLREMPNLVRLYGKYHGSKNFEIVGISLDNSQRAWAAAVKRLGLRWPQLSDLKVREGEAAQAYGIVNIPSNVLLNPKGVIIAADLMGEELARYLENLLED